MHSCGLRPVSGHESQCFHSILAEMPIDRPDRLQALAWIAVGIAVLWLLYELSPVLTPFMLAIILAYIFDPLVDRLEQQRVPRVVGTLLVILMVVGALTALVLILVPLVQKEVTRVVTGVPKLLTIANEQVLPWLKEHAGITLQLDVATVREFVSDNWSSAQGMIGKLLSSLGIGGLALFGFIANAVLAPVVMFYLLRDWDNIMARLDSLMPRPWHEKATRMARDIDAVLGEFLRGQLLVMLILAAYYSIALWIAGLESPLPVGVLSGLLVFIPYLGFAIGFALALLVAALQLQGLGLVIAVLIVYGVGQMVESFVLTPWLVGERIGLHPLAVIFALLAFGQVFGFFGVLLALPASAALLVALREVRVLYAGSRFYQG